MQLLQSIRSSWWKTTKVEPGSGTVQKFSDQTYANRLGTCWYHVISIRRFKASRSTNLRNTPSPIATSRIFARKVLERFEESSVSRYLSFVSSVCLMRIPPYPRPGDWVCVYHNADQCHATGDTRLHLSPSSQNNLRHTSQRPRDAVIRSPDRVEGLVGLGR